MLKVSVTQAPEKGKANKAVIELLAKKLGLKKSQIELIAGETSHQKRFLLREIKPDELAQLDLAPYRSRANDEASRRSNRRTDFLIRPVSCRLFRFVLLLSPIMDGFGNPSYNAAHVEFACSARLSRTARRRRGDDLLSTLAALAAGRGDVLRHLSARRFIAAGEVAGVGRVAHGLGASASFPTRQSRLGRVVARSDAAG